MFYCVVLLLWCAVVCVCYKRLDSGLVVNSVVMTAFIGCAYCWFCVCFGAVCLLLGWVWF